jgi:hypothetical protein
MVEARERLEFARVCLHPLNSIPLRPLHPLWFAFLSLVKNRFSCELTLPANFFTIRNLGVTLTLNQIFAMKAEPLP